MDNPKDSDGRLELAQASTMAATEAFDRACFGSFFIEKSVACQFPVRISPPPAPVSKSEFFRVYAQIRMTAR